MSSPSSFYDHVAVRRQIQHKEKQTKLSCFIKSITPQLVQEMQDYLKKNRLKHYYELRGALQIPLYEDLAAIMTIKKEQKDIFTVKDKMRRTIEYIANGFGRKYITVEERLKRKLCQLTPQQLSYVVRMNLDIKFTGKNKVLNTKGWPQQLIKGSVQNRGIRDIGLVNEMKINSVSNRDIMQDGTKSKKQRRTIEMEDFQPVEKVNIQGHLTNQQKQDFSQEELKQFRKKFLSRRDKQKIQMKQKQLKTTNKIKFNLQESSLGNKNQQKFTQQNEQKSKIRIQKSKNSLKKESDFYQQRKQGNQQKQAQISDQIIQKAIISYHPQDQKQEIINPNLLKEIWQQMKEKQEKKTDHQREEKSHIPVINKQQKQKVSDTIFDNFQKLSLQKLIDSDSQEKKTNYDDRESNYREEFSSFSISSEESSHNHSMTIKLQDENWMDQPSNQEKHYQQKINSTKKNKDKLQISNLENVTFGKCTPIHSIIHNIQDHQKSINQQSPHHHSENANSQQQPRRKNRAINLLKDPEFITNIDQHVQQAKYMQVKLYYYSRKLLPPPSNSQLYWFCDNKQHCLDYRKQSEKYKHLKWTQQEDDLLYDANLNFQKYQQKFQQLVLNKRGIENLVHRMKFLGINLSRQLKRYIQKLQTQILKGNNV